MSVAGLNDGSVLVREVAQRVPARPQQRPGRGMPQAVRAVLEDNIGELVEVRMGMLSQDAFTVYPAASRKLSYIL